MTTRAWLVCLALATVSVAGCGGKSSPTAPTPQPYSQSINGTVSSFGTTSHAVTIPRAGNARWSVSWPLGGDLDVYLTGPDCTGYPPDNCSLLAKADGLTANPEVVTRTVTSGERFILWVDSFASEARNYTIQFTIE